MNLNSPPKSIFILESSYSLDLISESNFGDSIYLFIRDLFYFYSDIFSSD